MENKNMTSESIEQITNSVYETYVNAFWGHEDVPQKDWFINEIKHNEDFSNRWDLKIEERELTMKERITQYEKAGYCKNIDPLDWAPTKLISVTHKNNTIHFYK